MSRRPLKHLPWKDSVAASQQAERHEYAVIQSFMRKHMAEDKAKAAVTEVIKSVGATSVKAIGKRVRS